MIGNPTEVVLVRMCADGAKPPTDRFAYGNALQGLYRVCREEGFSAFSNGLAPNVARSILMSKRQVFTERTSLGKQLTRFPDVSQIAT